MSPTAGPRTESRLAHVILARDPHGADDSSHEAPMVFAHREALIFTLGKAAALEHLVMCQYLYAAFSLKEREDEGLNPDQLPMVRRWRRELLSIGGQEMLHLALVQNLLTAVGGAPHLARPNFPVPPQAYPAGIRMALLPFGEEALRHFAFLERPEGMDLMADAEGSAALEKAVSLPPVDESDISPGLQDFETIGHLYRSVEDGLEHLARRFGERGLFIGPPRAQATGGRFRWEELVAVTDLASAHQAIDTIVEQGEGARGDWHDAHFGRLIRILDEFLAARAADPAFDPTRPVLQAAVRPPESGAPLPLITDHFSNRCVDLLNAVYEVLLQVLARYFAHTDETDEQLATLAEVAMGLMFGAIRPLGALVTRLPVGPEHPGAVVGPSFELFYDVNYLLPHRESAWLVMEERLREVADLAMHCRDHCMVSFMAPLAKITDYLVDQADVLAAAR
jgi:hypothetical protein